MKHRPSEAGYNLVFLMVTLTLFNIALAIALPKWSHAIRREREEELIARGFQYAEAIRIFQNRFQRLPVRLEELVEVEPRSIRKLWKDPMTDEGQWVLIPPGGQGQPLTPQQPRDDDSDGDGRDDRDRRDPRDRRERRDRGNSDDNQRDDDEEIDRNTGIGEKKGTIQVGPFIGVHSRSPKESILVFNGRTSYDQWHFTLDLLLGQGQQQQGGGPAGGGSVVGGDPARGLTLSTRWIGRPLPSFLNVPQGSLPQDQMQGGGLGKRGGGGAARR